jgi:hypothetical protein
MMPSDVSMQLFTREFVERKKEYSPFSVLKLIRPRYKILFKFIFLMIVPFYIGNRGIL